MSSSVSFKGGASKRVKRKAKLVSAGIMFAFVVLFSSVLSYGVAYYMKSNSQKQLSKISKDIEKLEVSIKKEMSSVSREAIALTAVKEVKYKGLPFGNILNELGNGMIKGVVLSNLSYDTTESNLLRLSGDATVYDVLAAQIKSWKGNKIFYDVTLSNVNKNEETGRYSFEAFMRVSGDSMNTNPAN